MIERRQQGRPIKGSNEVGRTRIVESLRSMMRGRNALDFSRKNLAEYSGVTPALITYYFPSREALIEEAAGPVIEEYVAELQDIISLGDRSTERLREVIKLLIRLYGRDGRILRAYEDLGKLNDYRMKSNHMQLMSNELSRFLGDLIGGGITRRYDVDVLQCAIRGMCEIVARSNLDSSQIDGEKIGGEEMDSGGKADALEADLAVRLFDLITYGLNCWNPTASLELPAMAGDAEIV